MPMSDSESKRIIRQWDREIEAENRRREAAGAAPDGPWKAVTWTALWLLWLALLIGLIGLVRPLH